MSDHNIIIIGDGPAGLSCGLVLLSANGFKGFADTLKVNIVGTDESDLLKTELYNVPFLKRGTSGKEALDKLKIQISEYDKSTLIQDKVLEVKGGKGDFFVKLESGKEINADYVVFATGFGKFDIAAEGVTVEEHKTSPKPNKVELKCDNSNKIKDGLYVAGLAAGVPTMFAAASGSGVTTACSILSDIAEKTTVIHDYPTSRNNI